MTRRRLPNGPNWADTLVKRYRKQLGVPEGKRAIPVPYEPDYVRAWGRSAGYMAYGSGHYGVVYPTRRPGVVLKLTRDASEAYFSQVAMDMHEKPAGMVRFYSVRELPSRGVPPPGRSPTARWDDYLTPRGVWAIWREDVPDIGFGALDAGRPFDRLPDKEQARFEKAWVDLFDYTQACFRGWVTAGHLLRQNLLAGRHGDADRQAVLEAKPPTRKAEAFLKKHLKPPPKVPLLPTALAYRETKTTPQPSSPSTQRAANLSGWTVAGIWALAELVGWAREAWEQRKFEGEMYRLEQESAEQRMKELVDSQKDSVSAGAMALALARGCAQRIAVGPMDTAGEALLFYMDRGIVLADVHTNNVGFVVRGNQARAVVTDPGHAVFLTDKYDDLQIKPLISKRSRNPGVLKRGLLR